MLGIRKKVAAVAAANELREEERDAATSMLTASSADTGSGSEPIAAAPAGSAPVSVALRAPVVITRWRREASPATQAARQQASVKQLERVPERRRAARGSGSGRGGSGSERRLGDV